MNPSSWTCRWGSDIISEPPLAMSNHQVALKVRNQAWLICCLLVWYCCLQLTIAWSMFWMATSLVFTAASNCCSILNVKLNFTVDSEFDWQVTITDSALRWFGFDYPIEFREEIYCDLNDVYWNLRFRWCLWGRIFWWHAFYLYLIEQQNVYKQKATEVPQPVDLKT